MAQAGKIDLTGTNAWTHGARLVMTFDDSADTFDFPGKSDVRLRLYLDLGLPTPAFTIAASNTGSMTRATGLLTIVLDDSVTDPDLSTLWTAITANSTVYVQLDYQENAGEDYVPFAAGPVAFDYPGSQGSSSTAAFTFTHTSGGVAFTSDLSFAPVLGYDEYSIAPGRSVWARTPDALEQIGGAVAAAALENGIEKAEQAKAEVESYLTNKLGPVVACIES